MKKIQVIEYAERWTNGGIESYLFNIIKKIDKEKFNVKILVAQKETTIYDDMLKECGCDIEVLLDKVYSNPIERVVITQRTFKRYISKYRCDVLHLHICQGVALKYAKYAKQAGVKKVISHCHNTEVGDGNKLIKLIGHNWGKKLYKNYVDEKIACSDLAAQWLYTKRDLRENKVAIYLNIINVDNFRFSKQKRREMRKKYNLTKENVYLTVGRMDYQKNQIFLLDIFKEILNFEPMSRLILIGTGALRKETYMHAKKRGIYDNVIWVDQTKDVLGYMCMADVFILPSLFEGNPIVGIEAQAAGLPCYFSSVITKQAKILDTATFISLKKSAKDWSNIIKNTNLVPSEMRLEAYKTVKTAGYDLSAQVKMIERLYGD